MDNSKTQHFTIRVWLEQTDEEPESATWRGHITHIPSGTRRYFDNGHDVLSFMTSYLGGMGAHAGTLFRSSRRLLESVRTWSWIIL